MWCEFRLPVGITVLLASCQGVSSIIPTAHIYSSSPCWLDQTGFAAYYCSVLFQFSHVVVTLNHANDQGSVEVGADSQRVSTGSKSKIDLQEHSIGNSSLMPESVWHQS